MVWGRDSLQVSHTGRREELAAVKGRGSRERGNFRGSEEKDWAGSMDLWEGAEEAWGQQRT